MEASSGSVSPSSESLNTTLEPVPESQPENTESNKSTSSRSEALDKGFASGLTAAAATLGATAAAAAVAPGATLASIGAAAAGATPASLLLGTATGVARAVYSKYSALATPLFTPSVGDPNPDYPSPGNSPSEATFPTSNISSTNLPASSPMERGDNNDFID